jgi:MecA-like transpeptidase family protein
MSTNRSLLIIGAGVLALVVVAAAIVLLAEGRDPRSFAPGSPEEAMQRYLAAWDERDYEGAYAFFSEEIRASTTLDEYQNQVRAYGDGLPIENTAAYIDDVEGTGDRVTLHLTIEQFYDDGGPGGGSTYRNQRAVRMVREADGWKVDEPLIGLEPAPFGEFPI